MVVNLLISVFERDVQWCLGTEGTGGFGDRLRKRRRSDESIDETNTSTERQNEGMAGSRCGAKCAAGIGFRTVFATSSHSTRGCAAARLEANLSGRF